MDKTLKCFVRGDKNFRIKLVKGFIYILILNIQCIMNYLMSCFNYTYETSKKTLGLPGLESLKIWFYNIYLMIEDIYSCPKLLKIYLFTKIDGPGFEYGFYLRTIIIRFVGVSRKLGWSETEVCRTGVRENSHFKSSLRIPRGIVSKVSKNRRPRKSNSEKDFETFVHQSRFLLLLYPFPFFLFTNRRPILESPYRTPLCSYVPSLSLSHTYVLL